MLSLDPHRDAVIVVDVQNDFCPGGALAVPEGDKVIPPLNALLGRADCFIVATRDWHPANHCSFTAQARACSVGYWRFAAITGFGLSLPLCCPGQQHSSAA